MKARLRQPKWFIPLSVIVLGAVVEILADELATRFTLAVLSYTWKGIKWTVAHEMGYGGLALVGWAALLMLASVIASRPVRVRKKPEAASVTPQLTLEELALVEDIRGPWNRYGREAANSLQNLFAEVLAEIRDGKYWGPLLQPKIEQLDRTIKALNSALDMDKPHPPSTVKEQFNAFYQAYFDVIMWLGKLRGRGDTGVDRTRFDTLVARWKPHHARFHDKLQDLHHAKKAHHAQLMIQPPPFIEDEHAARFIIEAYSLPTSTRPTGEDEQ